MLLSRRSFIPLVIAIPLFMQNLDTSILATALPQISRSLAVDPLHLNLAITSYLLSLAVFIPLSGWAADKYGARLVFRFAVVLFTIGSVFCGMANGFWELVMARVLQGMGGALMVPVARLILVRTFQKEELLTAMIWFTVPATLGPMSGPVVGGAIVTYFSWRWIFFINVPIGIIALLLVAAFIKDNQKGETPPFDIASFLLMAVTLVGLMFGLETVGRNILPDIVTILFLAVGIMALFLYIVHWWRFSRFPIIDLRMFKLHVFGTVTLAGMLCRTMMGGSAFLIPLVLQLGFGLSPFAAGLLTFASATGALFMRFGLKLFLRHFGFRSLMVGCGIISSALFIGYGWFESTTAHYIIFALLFVGGYTRSVVFTGLQSLAYADVGPGQMSRATTIASVAQQLSISMGVAMSAMAVNAARAWYGQTAITAADFRPGFIAVGTVSLIGALMFLHLRLDAGQNLVSRAQAK